MANYDLGQYITLSEIRKSLDPLGEMAVLINEFTDNLPELLDATMKEANRGTFESITRTEVRPSGTYTAYNEGIVAETSGLDNDVEPTAMLDGMSRADARLIDNNGGLAQRLRLDKDYMAGMAKTVGSDIFNSDRDANPRKPRGILKRPIYYSVSSTEYCFDNAQGSASATENKTAAVVIQWGEGLTNLIYPKNGMKPGFNTTAGITARDMGLGVALDPFSKEYPVYRTWLQAYWGLAVENRKSIHSLVNVTADPTVIDNDDDFGFNENVCFRMRQKVKKTNQGRGAVMYVSDAMEAAMWDRANGKSNVLYKGTDVYGNDVVKFIDIMVRATDSIPEDLATAV